MYNLPLFHLALGFSFPFAFDFGSSDKRQEKLLCLSQVEELSFLNVTYNRGVDTCSCLAHKKLKLQKTTQFLTMTENGE
jgi:hypothetical protein